MEQFVEIAEVSPKDANSTKQVQNVLNQLIVNQQILQKILKGLTEAKAESKVKGVEQVEKQVKFKS